MHRGRSRYRLAVVWFLIVSPTVRAHFCGPLEISVEVGQDVDWRISADLTEIESDYTPDPGGTDSAIATVTPVLPFKSHHGDFTFTGVTVGETVFTADWFYAATGAGGTCTVMIRVVAEGSRVANRSGLLFPDRTINFDEVPLSENEPILNAFSGCGVRFSPGVLHDTSSDAISAISGSHARNAPQSNTGLIGFPKANPFTISFTDDVSAVAVGLRGSPPGTTITALFEGDVVDSLLAPTTIDPGGGRFFGFNGIRCDELRIENLGDGLPPSTPEIAGFVRLDNLQFSLAEPDVTLLDPGGPVSFELLGCRRSRVFEVSPPIEGPLIIELSDPDPSNGNALYFGWGEIPTPVGFDHAADQRSEANQRLVIPGGRDEPAFLLVRGNVFADGANELTLSVRAGEFFLERMSAGFVGRGGAGQVSASVLGCGFAEGTVFRLTPSAGGESVVASETLIVAGDRAEVSFSLPGAPVGLHDLEAERPDGRTTKLVEAFEVVDSSMGPILEVSLRGVTTSRYDRPSSLTLTYRNVGDAQMTAPLFKIVGPPDTRLRLAREDEFPDDGDENEVLHILGIHQGAIPGTLAPGAEVQIPLEFRTRTCFDCEATFEVFVFTPTSGDPVGWDELGAPAGTSDETWRALWPELSVSLGGTWREAHAALAGLATRLARRGVYGACVPELFRFSVREALGRPSASIRGRVRTEEGVPQSGQVVAALEEGVVKTTATTDDEGAFALDWLEPGATYELAVVDHRIVETGLGGVQVRVPTAGELPAVELVTVADPNGLAPACPNCDESELPTGPPPLPDELFTRVTDRKVTVVSSWDPNEKNGPQGVGDEHLIAPDETIEYTIHFENKAQASAAAQLVTVTDVLDPDLDWSTFRFGDVKIGFDEAQIWSLDDVGRDLFSGYGRNPSSERYSGLLELETVDLSGGAPENEELIVVLTTSLNLQTGIVVWTFLALTSGPLSGFLPPNCTEECPDCSQVPDGDHECKDGRGEAQVTFTIDPEEDLEEGTEIENTATVQFDNLDELDVDHDATISYFLPPEEPRNPRPPGGLEPEEESVVLQWESRRAESFDVFVWTSGDERPPDPVARDVAERFFVLSQDQRPETSQLWTVVARNAFGEASPAAPWELTQAEPCEAPPAPMSPMPPDGALDVSPDRLDWEAGAGAGESYAVFLWPAEEERPPRPLAAGLRSSHHAPRERLRARTSYHWQVIASSRGCESPGPVWSFSTSSLFERGDANVDGAVNISDPIFTLSSLFLSEQGPACEESLDANDDGAIDVSDAVYALQVIAGEAAMPPPVAGCGVDPTEDELSCEAFEVCD